MIETLLILGGLVCIGMLLLIRRQQPPSRHTTLQLWLFRIIFTLLALTAAMLLIGGGYWLWFNHRSQPAPLATQLFHGVTYIRDVRTNPRPLIIHLVKIDLDADGIRFLVTPARPAEGHETRAQTTSEFLASHDLQVAINGGFFYPFHANSPWDFYPRSGDPVDILGVASSAGKVYSHRAPKYTFINISPENQVEFGETAGPYNALSGKSLSLDQPEPDDENPGFYGTPHPRSALAVDRDENTLLLIVVDGRQPNYSEGVTLDELARLIVEYGGDEAINFDGGGSSTLAVQGPGGSPRLLNTPIHTRIPGRERPVANHLGVFAEPLPETE